MKKFNSLKSAFAWMAILFVGMVVFASCSKDDITGHDDANQSKGKIVVKEDTTKKQDPVYRDSTWVTLIDNIIKIDWRHFTNDSIDDADSIKTNFGAQIARDKEIVETREERIDNLDFTFGEVGAETRDGKMNFLTRQKVTDADGQSYNGLLTSGYATLKNLQNVHAKLVTFKKTGMRNIPMTPEKNEAKRMLTRIGWKAVYTIENAPNLAGKEFEMALDSTDHIRFIPKGAPTLLKTDTLMIPTEHDWYTDWKLLVIKSYDNDSTSRDSMYVRLNATAEMKKLDDKFVSNLVDYVYNNNDIKWNDNWESVESNNSAISLEKLTGHKLGYGENGIDKDKFSTDVTVTKERATVLFAGYTWNVPAANVTLKTTQKVFKDETSDLDGYTMLHFYNTENAYYNGAYEKELAKSCKLYLKVATPEVESFLFDQTVVRTTKKVTVTTVATPVYDNGTKGDSAKFVLNLDETFKCLNNISFEKIQEMSEVTGTLVEDGEVSIEKNQKFEVEAGGYKGTYTCNKYTQKYVNTVTSNGVEQKHNWEAVWYDDFEFELDGKKNTNSYDKVKSTSVSNAKDDNHLTKSTSLSTEELEVYLYACNGTFTIDGVDRSDIAPGTFTKVVIGENHWDESTKGQEHTAIYSKRWCKYIRYKADGTVTEQLYEAVFNNLTGGSEHRVTAEKPVYTSGTVVPLAPSSEARTDDFCSFDAIKYSFEKDAFYEGAAESKKDFANFTVSENAYFEVEGNKVYFDNPEHSISHTDSELKQVSETDEVTTYERSTNWTFTFGGAQLTATSKGIVDIIKSQDTPDFNYSIEGIIESVSRPSNRTGVPVTAYTGLFLLDGNKCQPYGIYKDAQGDITFVLGDVVDRFEDMNGACWEKNQNKVVPTRCVSADGFVTWYRADGSVCDAAKHSSLQEVGFNDRGNDHYNHTGNYKPQHTKKNGVEVVTWSGIPESVASYTYRGWK